MTTEKQAEILVTFNEDKEDVPNTIKVLLHDSYGSEGLPGWLFDEYIKRKGIPDHCFCAEDEREDCQFCQVITDRAMRYDPLCLEIMRDASERKFQIYTRENEPDAKKDMWRAQTIPWSCKDCFRIREYDGKESLEFDQGILLFQLLSRRQDEVCKEVLQEYHSIAREFYPGRYRKD